MTLIGGVILLVNVYYYAHPLLKEFGLTSQIVDAIFLKLRSGGVFSTPYLTKGLALLLLGLCLITRSGKGWKINWWWIIFAGVLGAFLYFVTPHGIELYLVSTTLGLGLLCWAIAMVGRNISSFNEAINDRMETFQQCEKLMQTDDSINIPTSYQYKYKIRKGWINVINPYRATMVLGTPGSGKSFSVYGPFIEQMIEKSYTMFVYDYKYPDLTEIVYNEYLSNCQNYPVEPEFCVINFKDPRYSLRCNPINPRYIKDPMDTTEIAELVMLNVNKAAIEKEDFFTLSAKMYLDALLWFLKLYEDGRYCTFPHVIELMAQDYKKVFSILSRYPELEAKIKPFSNALEGGAQDQLQGQIASAQIPLNKFVSRSLYWVLTGDDFSLEINDPLHPKILCVGNDPDRQAIYGTTLALFTSRMFKLINHKGKQKCGVLLDELPTIYIKGIDNLIATARSNKVAIVLGAQDKSQLKRDYGEKESEVIFNTVGNIFSGQVNGKTAEELSKSFGKEFRRRESETRGIDQESVNISFQHEELLPVSTIETLSQGVFFGKVADNNDMKIKDKFFCGEIKIDLDKMQEKRKHWQSLPQFTDFGEAEIRKVALAQTNDCLLEHYSDYIRVNGAVVLHGEDLRAAAQKMIDMADEQEKDAIMEKVISQRIDLAVQKRIQENFMRVQNDVREIIRRECEVSQEITPHSSIKQIDLEKLDPFEEPAS